MKSINKIKVNYQPGLMGSRNPIQHLELTKPKLLDMIKKSQEEAAALAHDLDHGKTQVRLPNSKEYFMFESKTTFKEGRVDEEGNPYLVVYVEVWGHLRDRYLPLNDNQVFWRKIFWIDEKDWAYVTAGANATKLELSRTLKIRFN